MELGHWFSRPSVQNPMCKRIFLLKLEWCRLVSSLLSISQMMFSLGSARNFWFHIHVRSLCVSMFFLDAQYLCMYVNSIFRFCVSHNKSLCVCNMQSESSNLVYVMTRLQFQRFVFFSIKSN